MLAETITAGARAWGRPRRLSAAAYAIALLAGGTVALATAPAASAAATPAFVQQASAHGSSKSSIAATTGASVATGDRLVVEVGVWNSKSATTSSVTDSLGNSFVEVTDFTASDDTQMSIWTAPAPAGGSADTVTAKPSAAADMAIIVLEYSGLSTVSDITAVDQFSHSTGKTTAATTVQSVPTAPATNSNELAVGFYADSGFGDTLTGGSGWSMRANVSPTSDVEMLAEDQPVSVGATPAASVGTGPDTIWLMATVVFSSGTQSAPGAPTEVGGSPGNDSANLTWTAPTATAARSPVTRSLRTSAPPRSRPR